MEISWKNDQEYLYLALNGSTDGWLSIGFEPLEWMKNADIILASVQGSKAIVLDEYCTGNYGPHIEDTMLGGTNDITEFGGSKGAGRTVIELKRKLDTGDRFDKAFSPGQTISIIWALSQESRYQPQARCGLWRGHHDPDQWADDDKLRLRLRH